MTLDDWVLMKEQLKKELNGVVCGFVRIGSILRRIEEQKLYEKDGYKSIAEFAKAEYKLEGYDVSRFIGINRRFTLEEDSERLRPEFEQLGYSKLSDMLKLPDSDLTMITPETKRADIRELKRFNRAEPEQETDAGIKAVIESFFEENPEILNELYAGEEYRTGNIGGMAERINPAGTRTYRKGMYFLMMYENGIKVKKFGGSPAEMSWKEFFQIMQEIFGEDADGSRTYENHFGAIVDQKEEVVTPEEAGKKQAEPNQQESAVKKEEKTGTSDFAPAQKKPENTESEADFQEPIAEKETGELQEQDAGQQAEPEEDQVPGQMEITRDMPEYCPENINPPEEPQNTECEMLSEIEKGQLESLGIVEACDIASEKEAGSMPKAVYGSRKQYIDTLTEYGAALYLAASLRSMRNITFSKLIEPEYWEKWLKTEVDEHGEKIDIVE